MENLTGEYYINQSKLPHSWCSGCGYGIILGSITRSMAAMNMTMENTLVATGIGCWGKSDDYLATNGLHTTHGRAIAFATGVAINKPELDVITLVGDGDGSTIGGNHLLHAAKRNINMTVIMADNLLYGQTGGQYSAVTPYKAKTQTSQFGNPEPAMDVCAVVAAAGANYVARGTAFHINQLDKLIKKAMSVRGFSFVEVLSPCPAHFGTKNDYKSAVELMNWIKNLAVPIDVYNKLSDEEKQSHMATGTIIERDNDDFSTRYEKIRREALYKVGGAK